jgi:ribulose-phosphate 3-epimerase
MLFFPDLVKAMRRHTARPFEVHLITTHPLNWIEPFAEAGADSFIIYLNSQNDPHEVIRRIKSCGKEAGISLTLQEPVDLLEPFWSDLDLVCIVGTEIGIKGASMDPSVPDRIRRTKQMIQERTLTIEVEADGGIRRNSVPQMYAAGVDWIVPGSLMFGEDPAAMRQWLATLRR